MVIIPSEQLEKYKEIYQRLEGVELSDKEALEQAVSLVDLMSVFVPYFEEKKKVEVVKV